jgi:hypothetical protein
MQFKTNGRSFHYFIERPFVLSSAKSDCALGHALDASTWRPHESGKTMICGHRVPQSGRPLLLDRAICIDTWVYGDGWLTCLEPHLEVYCAFAANAH